jgi:hypothetical protein
MGGVSGWQALLVSLLHGSVMPIQMLLQVPGTFVFCGHTRTIPRETVLDELHDVLLKILIFTDNRIAVITRFHNESSFMESEEGVERRTVAAMFSIYVDNELLSQWLDRQIFSFSSWSPEDARTETSCIINNPDVFPLIYRGGQYIKSRILP